MKSEIILRDPRNVEFAIDQIKSVDLSETHVVTIKPFKRTRSQAQNAVMWLWLTVIGDQVGMTKDELHLQFKAQYLMPVVLRDNLDDYAVSVHQKMHDLWKNGRKEEAKMIKRLLVNYISTGWLNVAQFTEYLREIEGYARDGNIALPYPEDYHQAMGIK